MEKKIDPGFWLGLLLFILMMFMTSKCQADNVDTVLCHKECIQKIVQINKNNKPKIYVVYVDKKHNISDLIPMSKTTYEYYALCMKNGVEPTLGLKLKNGNIMSIVKYRKKYKVYGRNY